MIKVLLILEVH